MDTSKTLTPPVRVNFEKVVTVLGTISGFLVSCTVVSLLRSLFAPGVTLDFVALCLCILLFAGYMITGVAFYSVVSTYAEYPPYEGENLLVKFAGFTISAIGPWWAILFLFGWF